MLHDVIHGVPAPPSVVVTERRSRTACTECLDAERGSDCGAGIQVEVRKAELPTGVVVIQVIIHTASSYDAVHADKLQRRFASRRSREHDFVQTAREKLAASPGADARWVPIHFEAH